MYSTCVLKPCAKAMWIRDFSPTQRAQRSGGSKRYNMVSKKGSREKLLRNVKHSGGSVFNYLFFLVCLLFPCAADLEIERIVRVLAVKMKHFQYTGRLRPPRVLDVSIAYTRLSRFFPLFAA